MFTKQNPRKRAYRLIPGSLSYFYLLLHRFTFCNFRHLRFVETCIAMNSAVGQIAVHSVNLGQVSGTAYRAHIHLQFLMTAVIAVRQRQVHTFIIPQ